MDFVAWIAFAASVGSGLIAGVFFAFSSFVMPALARLPAEQGVAAMQRINIDVINWHFLGAFMGTAVLSLVAIGIAALHWGEPPSMWLATGGASYFIGTFVVTIRGNLPLNDALAKLQPADPATAEQWRNYVARWSFWNHIRTAASLLAALLFTAGLLNP